jgi:crossover junction endodeoxyribonuclease RuvC
MGAMSGNPARTVVLGVDPGTHVLGWGVVACEGPRLVALGYGVVRAPAAASIDRRLGVIAGGLRDVVARFAPAEAAIEEVFFGRDARAAVRIGEGRGAALVVLAEAGVEVSGYTNNVVKRSVTGAGRAGKERVRTMVRAILALHGITGPHDASDALALAICRHHARSAAGAQGATAGAGARGAPAALHGPAPAGRYAPRVEAALRAMRAQDAQRAARAAR